METAVIYVTILGVISEVTGQQVDVEPVVFSYLGQTINLHCALTNATGIHITQVSWAYKSEDGESINIAAFVPNYEPSYPNSTLKGRVSFSPSPPNLTNPSIQIRDVRMSDEGNYICQYVVFLGGIKQGITFLDMLEQVANVTVTASSTDLVESSSVRLSCSSSGSSLSFLWLNGSSEVTASDRVQLTDGNTTLTIVSVTRYDQGPFRCHVFNAVSNGTSDPVLISISYGPENVEITGPTKSELEQTIILICSAESTPPANYTWILNGKEILRDSSILIKTMRTSSDGELYICQARNYVTGRTSSGEHILFVKELGGLSAGAIAGIVVSCLLGTGGALGGGFYIYKNKLKSSAHSHETDQEENVYENTK